MNLVVYYFENLSAIFLILKQINSILSMLFLQQLIESIE